MNFQQVIENLKSPGDRFKRSSESDNEAFELLGNGKFQRVKPNIKLNNLLIEDGLCKEKVKTEDEPFNPSFEYLKSENFMFSPDSCFCWHTILKSDTKKRLKMLLSEK